MCSCHTSAADWRAAANFVGELALAESLPELDAFAPAALRRLFAADLVVWERWGRDIRHVSYRVDPDLSQQITTLHAAFERHFPDHPAYFHFQQGTAKDLLFILSDFGATRRFLQTGLWDEVYIHLRGKHQLGISNQVDGAILQSTSLNRLQRDFGPRDRELARFIQPHLIRATQAIMRRELAQRSAGMLAEFFGQADAAFALMKPTGQIVEISMPARKLLADAASPQAMPDRLPRVFGELHAHLRRGGDPLRRKVFVTVPLAGDTRALVLWLTAGDVALVIFQRETGPEGSGHPALTRRETEILGWLGEGKTNGEIGTLLGISMRTVEKHCGNLFAKLGVETRLAAALFMRR